MTFTEHGTPRQIYDGVQNRFNVLAKSPGTATTATMIHESLPVPLFPSYTFEGIGQQIPNRQAPRAVIGEKISDQAIERLLQCNFRVRYPNAPFA